MNESIKTLAIPDMIGDKIFAITAGASIVHTYDDVNNFFSGDPKMKLEMLQDAEKWKGSILSIQDENDQAVIIEVKTNTGVSEQGAWDLLFIAATDELIRRGN